MINSDSTARWTMLLITNLALAGCTIYAPRTSIEPEMVLPETFADPGIETTDRWWVQLGDDELAAVVDQAMISNHSLRMAWARLNQLRAVARIAGAAQSPTSELKLSSNRRWNQGDQPVTPAGPTPDTVDTLLASINVGYQVDLWKKIANTRAAELLAAEASRQDVDATALTVVGTAAELWCSRAASRATLDLLAEQVGVSDSFQNLVEMRFVNGLNTAVEVYQQRLQVASVRGQMPAIQSQFEIAEHQLNVLLGLSPRSPLAAPGALAELPALPATGVPLEVLRSRPDVRFAELQLLAADHRLAAAVADRFPTLTLGLTASSQAESLSSLLDAWFLDLAGSLFGPLLDGGRRKAEVVRQRAVVEERFLAWEAALLQACREVEDALSLERGLEATRRALSEQEGLARASLARSRTLYANGLTDYLTVLTSLQALQNLERATINNHLDLLVNRIRLHLALGGAIPLEEPV